MDKQLASVVVYLVEERRMDPARVAALLEIEPEMLRFLRFHPDAVGVGRLWQTHESVRKAYTRMVDANDLLLKRTCECCQTRLGQTVESLELAMEEEAAA